MSTHVCRMALSFNESALGMLPGYSLPSSSVWTIALLRRGRETMPSLSMTAIPHYQGMRSTLGPLIEAPRMHFLLFWLYLSLAGPCFSDPGFNMQHEPCLLWRNVVWAICTDILWVLLSRTKTRTFPVRCLSC